jgi:glycosyltransferase involved in cell wall biosynthesis
MKIAIIGTAHPFRGGLSAFNERLAKEFIAEGHDVTIYTFTLQYPNFLFPGKTQYSDEPAPKDLKIVPCINSINPFNWIKIGRRIKKERFDVAIFCYWMSFMAPCFGSIARIIGNSTKRIGLVHNLIPHEKTVLDRIFPRYFVASMDGFTTMSQSVLNDIDCISKKNTPKTFSPHPIYDHFGIIMNRDEALKELGLEREFRYILFFGLIRAYKGLDLLLKAFADERLRKYPVKLLIAGEFYESPEHYLDIIRENNLSEYILICDEYIPDREVRAWFSAADIVVQPYISATQSGISQIAYHFEKPMLVTNVGGLAEIVPDGKAGYVVEPEVTKVADALIDFFKNNRKENLEQGVKEEKKRFLWSSMTAAILSLVN